MRQKLQVQIFNASGFKVGIVCAQFNPNITQKLLIKSLKRLRDYKIKPESVAIFRVAGSVEIPLLLKAMAKIEKYDCLVALGAIIRGETPHFDFVAKIVSEGILRVMLDTSVPVGFGVLTVNNSDQALARLDCAAAAVDAALLSAKLLRKI